MNNILSGKYLLPFFVMAIVLVIGGAFVWSQMNQSPAEQESQATPNLSPSPTPTPMQEPVTVPEIPEDWQTYRDDEFGFKVKYPPDWEFEEKEQGNTLYSFRLYDPEEDMHQKDQLEKCRNENPPPYDCAGSSSVWWVPGIHITLTNNPQKLELAAIADEWTKTRSYTFGLRTFNIGSLEVVQGNAMTKLGQDAFLFLNPSGNIQFLVEDIPSHENLTEQILSSIHFGN
ncbi:MAG TPA: hypothetical protein VGA53_01285 [Candidatus Paceibacterota bacterium]